MKLIVQPGDSIVPLLKSIDSAKNTIEVLIFRFDRKEVELALERAAKRGVAVHALIAYVNRGGEKGLRQLEMRFLEAGITVSRTSNDLLRYHGKMLIVDRRILFVLGFNYTYMDIERSRSFGYMTRDRKLVAEAVKLFEADATRQPYTPSLPNFVVSPVNSRRELGAFIKAARTDLRIYDPKVSDPAMISLLSERAKAGVNIRIIGRLTKKHDKIAASQLRKLRLHARAMIRDQNHIFIGSQSLRKIELDQRREVGVIFSDAKSGAALRKIFDDDWADIGTRHKNHEAEEDKPPVRKVAKRVAKAIADELPPIATVVQQAMQEVGGNAAPLLDPVKVEETAKEAVKKAVKEMVKEAVKEAAAK